MAKQIKGSLSSRKLRLGLSGGNSLCPYRRPDTDDVIDKSGVKEASLLRSSDSTGSISLRPDNQPQESLKRMSSYPRVAFCDAVVGDIN